MKRKVILISGFKGVGKDFVANQIHDELIDDYSVKIDSFASPLKKIATILLETDSETLDKAKNERWDIALNGYKVSDTRLFLQKLGTEAMKPIFGNNVWASLMLRNVICSMVDFFIIPDFRFMIEHEELIINLDKDLYDVITIRVEDKNRINTDLHSSETELLNCNFKFDFILDNTGKTDSIRREVYKLVKTLKTT